MVERLNDFRPAVRVRPVDELRGGDRQRVVNEGPGIPQEVVDTLNRGYETSLDHNSGLGLWLVTWVVDTSNGTAEFSGSTDGAVVSLSLERAREGPEGIPSIVRLHSAMPE